ncbi:hypothetical protein Ciccas_002331 [Cichlidogyrus casuarinus]|uniref:Uncharacterized protein n=1 Tax=Cichlidogyrus casuarinus TaxID=1844966 RepID=A0ABD2QHH8_9PLAT
MYNERIDYPSDLLEPGLDPLSSYLVNGVQSLDPCYFTTSPSTTLEYFPIPGHPMSNTGFFDPIAVREDRMRGGRSKVKATSSPSSDGSLLMPPVLQPQELKSEEPAGPDNPPCLSTSE